MKLTRRHLVQLVGTGALAPLAVGATRAFAQDH